jgi:hypothetical protein
VGVCCRLVNTRREEEVLEVEYHDSLPLSFFLSCGNIMAGEKEVKKSGQLSPLVLWIRTGQGWFRPVVVLFCYY